MKKLITFMVLAAFASCLFAPPAQARPQYGGGLKKAYPDNKKVNAEKNCGVCHGKGGADKKNVSDYGKALVEALGKKNESDKEKVAAGIKKVGEMKVDKDKDDSKTYDEIFKAGELPAPAKDK